MIRVAAVGDLHVGPDSAGALREQLSAIHDKADVLLIAGDLTKSGEPEEAEALARELESLSVRVVAVLGNHDHHADRPAEIAGLLREVGVAVLEGDAVRIEVGVGPSPLEPRDRRPVAQMVDEHLLGQRERPPEGAASRRDPLGQAVVDAGGEGGRECHPGPPVVRVGPGAST